MRYPKFRDDLTDKKFNRWTVLSYSHSDQGSWWSCKCDCGTIRTIRQQGLIQGLSKSCGCFNREQSSKKNTLSDGIAGFNSIYNTYKWGAEKVGREFNLSKEDFRLLTSSNCHYCGCPPFNIKKKRSPYGIDYIYNGIDRKDNKKGYTLSNCVSCCKICNQAKHTFSYGEFVAWIKRIKSY